MMNNYSSRGKRTASISVEHGMVKLMVSKGQIIDDYRVMLANPRFFNEGHVSNPPRVAGIIENMLPQLNSAFKSANAVVPGFQNRLRVMEFPKGQGFDPRKVIAQEASRTMHVTPENYYITWRRLPDNLDRSRWLVLAALRRAIVSVMDTFQRAKLRISAVELRPFALARAVNQSEAIITWAAPDGCDVVIVKDSVPVEHQSLFWGGDLVEDSVLVDRLTEVTSRTLATFNDSSSEGPMPDDTPVFVCGSPISRRAIPNDDKRGADITQQICQNLRSPKGELDLPMDGGSDFPVNDLIVNAGLALRGA
ncbi:MAG: hypothetical protein BZY87_02915 [SAR202 cluster bacterium Io17-Chloro-G6]|nr:MAG: hypothetical protein BZY87_02915 [SAR202 cluster bacterium Io17-Chloro-G6]